jgi:methyl-accepting chemotaxis protein
MNAAIEAAHAGDAGRGFAVVASEIRKLAENSAIQSKEIIQHIDTMTSRVETGVAQTQQAGESFRSIIQDIRQTTQLVNQITAAMDEQRSGTDEILSSVGSVVDATNNVKQLTQDLNQQSQDIDHTMLDLVQISTHIREATTEQTRSNVEVSQMIGRLKDTSQGNVEVVSKLEQILQRFNLEGVSHDQTD